MLRVNNGQLISNFIDNENIFYYASNMSIEKDLKKDYSVLYSYKAPIAVNFIKLKKIIINKYRYTMTTKKQISNLIKMLDYKDYILVEDVRLSIEDNIIVLKEEIKEEKEVLKRKRLDHTIEFQKNYIIRLEDNLKRLRSLNKRLKSC